MWFEFFLHPLFSFTSLPSLPLLLLLLLLLWWWWWWWPFLCGVLGSGEGEGSGSGSGGGGGGGGQGTGRGATQRLARYFVHCVCVLEAGFVVACVCGSIRWAVKKGDRSLIERRRLFFFPAATTHKTHGRLLGQLPDPTAKDGGGGGKGGKGKGGGKDGEGDGGGGGEKDDGVAAGGGGDFKLRKAEKQDVDDDVKKAAREIREKAWKQLLEQMDMTPLAAEQYLKYKTAVETETRELRVTLDGLEAKSNERVWMKNQVVGDIDDNRLIDGITGERAIYKKRGEQPPELGAPLQVCVCVYLCA